MNINELIFCEIGEIKKFVINHIQNQSNGKPPLKKKVLVARIVTNLTKMAHLWRS